MFDCDKVSISWTKKNVVLSIMVVILDFQFFVKLICIVGIIHWYVETVKYVRNDKMGGQLILDDFYFFPSLSDLYHM